MPLAQPELQKQTLILYGELLCRRVDWAGKLVFASFNGASQTGLSAAASLAGAAALIVDADEASVHLASRDAAFDFVVKTLDEALRALKNEIRQGRPLSVALLAHPDHTTEQATQRGLAPDFTLLASPGATPLLQGGDRSGALQLGFSALTRSATLTDWLAVRQWSPYEMPSVSSKQNLRSPAEVIPKEDHIRHAWLRDISKYQRSVRQGARWLWLTPDEAREVPVSEEAVF